MRFRLPAGRLIRALCLASWLATAAAAPAQAPATPQTPTPAPKKEDSSSARQPSTDQQQQQDNQQQNDQQQNDQSQSDNSNNDSVSTFDSAVGYIDTAVPMNQLRLRFDAAYDSNRPTRAEYFYPKGGPRGRGFRRFSGKVDYQEFSAYMEGTLQPELSVFLNVPYRLINPELNPDHNGFSDLSAGFKYAFVYTEDVVASFQFQTWAPTGDGREGLGTEHVSLEPALLLYAKLTDKVHMESELRYWTSAGGTDFAGSLVRYGVGFSYGEHKECGWWVTPVVEFVGWTVLHGKEQVEPPGIAVKDAAGDTIINGKFGVRAGSGEHLDFYVGYGRALTGAVWYKDLVRAEVRFKF